jgi:hypothetical protein
MQLGGSDMGSVLHTGREEDFSDWDEEVATLLSPFFFPYISPFLFLSCENSLALNRDMVLALEKDGTPLLASLYVPLFFLCWFFQFVCD